MSKTIFTLVVVHLAMWLLRYQVWRIVRQSMIRSAIFSAWGWFFTFWQQVNHHSLANKLMKFFNKTENAISILKVHFTKNCIQHVSKIFLFRAESLDKNAVEESLASNHCKTSSKTFLFRLRKSFYSWRIKHVDQELWGMWVTSDDNKKYKKKEKPTTKRWQLLKV